MDYTERTVPQIAEAYYRNLLELSEVGEFDCLGHLDLLKRHTKKARFFRTITTSMSRSSTRSLRIWRPGARASRSTPPASARGGETMPGLRTLKRFMELGGQVVTVGSDAHRPADVAADFGAAERIASRCGRNGRHAFPTGAAAFHRHFKRPAVGQGEGGQDSLPPQREKRRFPEAKSPLHQEIAVLSAVSFIYGNAINFTLRFT